MTRSEAKDALENRTAVKGGKPNTEEYDEGIIVELKINDAIVAWKSGVKTRTDQRSLRKV